MRNNEKLQSKEILAVTAFKEEIAESLTREDAEAVFVERTGMLKSIEKSISGKLRDALHIKIEHERETLIEMVAEDVAAQEMHQKRNRILDYTYFKKKRLNLRRI